MPVRLHLGITQSGNTDYPVHFRLIRDGKVTKEGELSLPFDLIVEDEIPTDKKSYYRMIVDRDLGNSLVTNPIFVTGKR